MHSQQRLQGNPRPVGQAPARLRLGGGRPHLIEVLNFLIRLANGYFKLWHGWLGKSDASAVLAVLLPVTAVLALFFGLNLSEYLAFRGEAKKAAPASEPAETATADENGDESAETDGETAPAEPEIKTEDEDAEQDLQDKAE